MIELIFLGSSAAIQVPSFHCSCSVCQTARRTPKQRRTRASIALIDQETVLVDASPDLEFQLERESIRQIHRIFITHWHFDHVGGLAALAEPSSIAKWPRIEVYLPNQVASHFDQELAYMKNRVRIHPIRPGDKVELPDATWQIVKTAHTPNSVGFIVESSQKFAYLVDGVMPPSETLGRLKNLDFIILEATVDELQVAKGEKWMNFALQQAIDCWRRIGTQKCILTHISCHSWKNGELVGGLSESERREVEDQNPGLTFAHDGMRVTL